MLSMLSVIPGARHPDQARANPGAADLPPIDADTMAAISEIYDRAIRRHVEDRW